MPQIAVLLSTISLNRGETEKNTLFKRSKNLDHVIFSYLKFILIAR